MRNHDRNSIIAAAAILCFAALTPLAAPAEVEAPRIQWLSYADGLVQAEKGDKPLLINFTADWCKFCKKMKSETYTDPTVIAYLSEHFLPVMVDTQKEPDIAAEYFVRGLPTIWFLTATTERISNLPGYVDAPMFMNVLRYIATEAYADVDFKTFLDTAAQKD